MKAENSLLTQLAETENLTNAWNLLNKDNEDSYGLSGQSIKDFDQNLASNIESISKELKANTFRFSPTRAAVIKKDNGKYRPLQIPEIRDRIVLKALSTLLEEQFSETLYKSDKISFAYQRGKGVREAVLQMKSLYQKGGKVILKADIINFFEEVQKDKLLKEQIYPNLSDNSINQLIRASMSQRLGGLNRLKKEHKLLFKNAGYGIPQGNPLSPLLSNIYLSKFDLYLKKLDYSVIRYADDFIVVFKSEEEANKGYEEINKFLNEELSLKIHSLETKNGKTEIINPTEKELSFLSIKFDGNNIYPGKDTLGILKSRIKSVIKTGELNSLLYQEIYDVVEKWIALYSYTDIERYFDEIDLYLTVQLTKKFGNQQYKTIKCKKLTRKVRNKQYNKSTKSIWRNRDLAKILPKFFRIQKKQPLTHAYGSLAG